jgi:hypothetical protein
MQLLQHFSPFFCNCCGNNVFEKEISLTENTAVVYSVKEIHQHVEFFQQE